MSTLQCLGLLICLSPFVALFAYSVREFGWLEALLLFAVIGGLVALIGVGSALMTGDLS